MQHSGDPRRRPRPPGECAAVAWSPAPAMPAASSPPATPSVTPPQLADWLEARIAVDQPLTIHMTRLPSFLRAALCRRYRAPRCQGGSRRGDGRRLRPCMSAAAPAPISASAASCAAAWCFRHLGPMVLSAAATLDGRAPEGRRFRASPRNCPTKPLPPSATKGRTSP